MPFCGLVWTEGPRPTSEHFWPDSCCILRCIGEALNCILPGRATRLRLPVSSQGRRGAPFLPLYSCQSFRLAPGSFGGGSKRVDPALTPSHLGPEGAAGNRWLHPGLLHCHQGATATECSPTQGLPLRLAFPPGPRREREEPTVCAGRYSCFFRKGTTDTPASIFVKILSY